MVAGPFEAASHPLHHVLEGCMSICESVTDCDKGTVINKTCGQFLLAFGDVNEVSIIECVN